MTNMYGHRWSSQFSNPDAVCRWEAALARCSGEQLAKGLAACLNSGKEWPPTLPGFLALCKPKVEHPRMRDTTPKLPGPVASEAVHNREIEKAYGFLGQPRGSHVTRGEKKFVDGLDESS